MLVIWVVVMVLNSSFLPIWGWSKEPCALFRQKKNHNGNIHIFLFLPTSDSPNDMHEVELHFIAFTSGNFFACSAFYLDVDMSFLSLLLTHDDVNFDVK